MELYEGHDNGMPWISKNYANHAIVPIPDYNGLDERSLHGL
jgi:hypothetical protein